MPATRPEKSHHTQEVLVGSACSSSHSSPRFHAAVRVPRRADATISAPRAVFAHVNDFHEWEAWNPWGKIIRR